MISVDYYTRLEQGRVRASASALATIARALRLDDDQQAYLYEIAGKTDARPRRRRAVQRMRPAMRRLLDQLTQTPAVVLGRRMDILAWNSIAAALYTDFGRVAPAGRNYVRLLFTDPVVRGMHLEWEHDARDAVAALRMEAAKTPTTPDSRSWSGSSPSRILTLAPGGRNTTSTAPAMEPSTTGTRPSVTLPLTATSGAALTALGSASWS